MELYGWKRQLLCFVYGQQWTACEASNDTQYSPLLELPVQIICDIISRLPLKDILRCKSICKMFLKVIKDPYFVRVHLARAPISTTNLVLQENVANRGALHFFKFDLGESALSSSNSDDQNSERRFYHGLDVLSKISADFTFRAQRVHVIGSCNGLLCLYFDTSPFDSTLKPFYGIYNPILRERIKLPSLSVWPSQAYIYANHSGFGYCPWTKQYKVIRFLRPRYLNHPAIKCSTLMVAEIHTVGSRSWRRIIEVPDLKMASFDPLSNGTLHWINNSSEPSELISALDLEKEKFRFTAPPSHFTQHYVNKITWINTGVLRNCLCICYIYDDIEFEVWSMREYGVQESWTKEFSINFKFYCNLQVKDLQRPIKFLSNGELLFISTSDCLVSFSPRKKTFRELKSTARWTTELTAHDLGFTSIKEIAGERMHRVKKFELVNPKFDFL